MTRCESYPLCSGTIYFPTAPFECVHRLIDVIKRGGCQVQPPYTVYQLGDDSHLYRW